MNACASKFSTSTDPGICFFLGKENSNQVFFSIEAITYLTFCSIDGLQILCEENVDGEDCMLAISVSPLEDLIQYPWHVTTNTASTRKYAVTQYT